MPTITQEDTQVSLQARIPASLAKKLRLEAVERGCYPRDLVVEALTSYFNVNKAA